MVFVVKDHVELLRHHDYVSERLFMFWFGPWYAWHHAPRETRTPLQARQYGAVERSEEGTDQGRASDTGAVPVK